MKNGQSVYSMLINNMEYYGLVDVVKVKKNELTKIETKCGFYGVINSEAPGGGEIVVSVLAGSILDEKLRSLEHLTAPIYSATVASKLFEEFSQANELSRSFGSYDLKIVVCNTLPLSGGDKTARQYKLTGSFDVKLNVIEV